MKFPIVVAMLAATHVAAAAPPLDLIDTPAELTPSAAWQAIDVPASTGASTVIGAWRGPGGVTAAITRIAVGNPRAWSSTKRPAYLTEVIAGFAAVATAMPRTATPPGPVPTLDVDFTRTTPREQVAARVLLFRTYTLVLTVAGPAATMRAVSRDVTQLRASFALPAGWSPG